MLALCPGEFIHPSTTALAVGYPEAMFSPAAEYFTPNFSSYQMVIHKLVMYVRNTSYQSYLEI